MNLSSKEQQKVIENNRGLVNFYVQKYITNDSEYDDMISIGNIGLIKAMPSFDESRGIKFSTYAGRCIENEMRMYIKKRKKLKKEVSLETVISENQEEDTNLRLMDIIPNDEEDITEKYENNEMLKRHISIILNHLEERERLIILYKISGIVQKDIAQILGLSQSRVSRLEKSVREKVRKYSNDKKKFEGFFSVDIANEEFYQISFQTKNFKKLKKRFEAVLEELISTNELPSEFKLSCNKGKVTIRVIAELESFYFIARIIQEIEEFEFTFTSCKSEGI